MLQILDFIITVANLDDMSECQWTTNIYNVYTYVHNIDNVGMTFEKSAEKDINMYNMTDLAYVALGLNFQTPCFRYT